MNKIIKIFVLTMFLYFICTPKAYAYSVDNYSSKGLCGTYELDSFTSNGSMNQVGCYSDYNSAKNQMKAKKTEDLVILTKVNGLNKIIDANYAILDLSVNPTTLTYFYTDQNLTKQYTYMDTGSLYGGVDGAHIESAYSSSKGKWVAKVKIGSFTGWIPSESYEIVPLTWIKSVSSYTVSNESIKHNYVNKIQNTYSGSAGSTIGPKPSNLSTGTYYSYDGHYFYTTLKKMLIDYKNDNYNNAVNSTPYYNYYMYLSNHTKTNYSSLNIDEYVRNNLGYSKEVYGNKASSGTSRLYGKGTFFYNTQEVYGVNAILSFSLSRNETGNGRSDLAINKNNGFGLSAADSNPYQSANWYASFASSIFGYAKKWITNGYAKATDWRYFGPQFGEKYSGMGVKYAADTYWSEKMAANYYSFDKAYGLQDYNYYQEAIATQRVDAYLSPTTSSKWIYAYPEKEDAMIIVGEVEGQSINGSTKWYKVISDMNIDSNGNTVDNTYNWNTNYVYVPSAYVRKINTPKNGIKNINSITEYIDKDYTYDLYVENTYLKPKVAISIKDTSYYYDSTLTSKTGQNLLNNKYIMVYTAAYNKNNKVVAYLVTSDYFYDQKHWVSADSIKFVTSKYGTASITASGNAYTWVNYNTVDSSSTKISGLYTYTNVPIIEEVNSNGSLWYKVPVDLSSNNNSYGYTLASAPNVLISTSMFTATNNKPTIEANDIEFIQGDNINILENVTATDLEDGNITNKIEVIENTINKDIPGEYKITYKVTDSSNEYVTKTIKVIVKQKENNKPVIEASNKSIIINSTYNPLDNIKATDKEDGDITNKIVVKENNVDKTTKGTYKVTYKVTDSDNNTVEKTIDVLVDEKTYINEKSEFYLNGLNWKNNKYELSGYMIILNQDNNLDTKYELIIKNQNNDKTYIKELSSWTENTPFELGTENGKDYNNSWFKDNIDLTDIPNGDYDLYIRAYKGDYFSESILSNTYNIDIDKRIETSNQGYNFKVLLSLKSKKIELNIRDNLITKSTSNTFRNMNNNYDDISFIGNKLNLIGTSYNYDGTYNNQLLITRKLILEDNNSYKRYSYDLGSTNNGSYKVTSSDNKSKEYAWFNNNIDISNLDKGTYTMYIYTKTIDSEDYGELSDIFGSINEAESTINNKKYSVILNKEKRNRIELVVE